MRIGQIGLGICVGLLGLAGCAREHRTYGEIRRPGVRPADEPSRPASMLVGAPERAAVRSGGQHYRGADALPANVRAAALSYAPGIIVDVHPLTESAWVLRIWSDAGLRDVHVRDDGLVLIDSRVYKQDLIRALPPAVRSRVDALHSGGLIYDVDQAEVEGRGTYRIKTMAGGEQFFAVVTEDGQVLEQGPVPPAPL